MNGLPVLTLIAAHFVIIDLTNGPRHGVRCYFTCLSLQWRHNGRDSVSNHQPHDYLINRLFRRRSKKTLKLRVTGLCVGNSPGTGEFPAQMASNAENESVMDQLTDSYRQISNIGRTKSQHLNVSHLVLQLYLPNPLKQDVKSRVKM